MKTVEIAVRTSAYPNAALEYVIHAENFPSASPDIIDVTPLTEGDRKRKWIIRFRDNVFSWTEGVVLISSENRLEFGATGGDFRRMSGSWSAEATGGGSLVRYAAQIDLGVPIFDRIVEPLIARVLARALTDALTELLPDAVPVTDASRHPERIVADYIAMA